MTQTFVIAAISTIFLNSVAYPQTVVDISKDVTAKLTPSLKSAKIEQPLMTFRDHTGKNLGVNNGWLLKAKGTASVENTDRIDAKLFRIDYPEIKLPDGTTKPAYSDFSGNVQIEIRWTSTSRGERWEVVGPAKTLSDVLWGELNPKGTAVLSVEITKTGAKVDIKIKDVKVEPDADTRASEFAKERLIGPMLQDSVLRTLAEFGIAASK